MMPPPRWLTALVVTTGLVACGNDSGPSQTRDLVIIGSARDAQGEYVTNYSAVVRAERMQGSEWLPLGSADVGANGLFTIPIASIPDLGPTDSLVVATTVSECRGLRQARRAIASRELEQVLGDTLMVHLTIDSTTGRARFATGAVCAAGYRWPDPYARFLVGLDVQEITDSIRGRWQIAYRVTRATDHGSFAGVRRGDTLVVELRIEDNPHCAPGHRLWVLIEPDNVLGEAWYQSLGPCRADDGSFWFVNEDADWWPPADGGA